MFSKLLSWVKGVIDKMIGKKEINTALSVQVATSDVMIKEIDLWSKIYANKSPWLNDDVKSLNLGATIAAELSRMVTIEMKSEVTGSTRADAINTIYQKVVDDLRKQVEFGLAKGGLVFKPYVVNGEVIVDYVQADSYFPTAYDGNGNVTSAAFVESLQIGSTYYKRFEYHQFENGTETISNVAYGSKFDNAIGNIVPMDSVPAWAGIAPQVVINNLKKPMFAVFKTPFANTVDSGSPLGVSVFSRSIGLIEQADKQYSRLLWEFESGERALHVDVTAFGVDPETNKKRLPDKKLYKTLDFGSSDTIFHDFTPNLREENILNGLNALLMKIEDQCGLARGTLSNVETEARTATELKVLKQRSFATILDTQKQLQNTLEHLVYIIDVLCTLYSIAPTGKYETTFEWDDSIVSDRDKQFVELQTLETLGVITKEKLYAWYFGVTEEEAAKYVPKQTEVGGLI